MSEPFVGEIRMFGFTFAPKGWAFCDGSLLPISQNTALFSLLGTAYGGDGKTTFALPDLRDRAALHAGQGAGLTARTQGQTGGVAQVTLTETQLPGHSHFVLADTAAGGSTQPEGKVFGVSQARALSTGYSALTPATVMNAAAVSSAGGGQPHNNMPPYLAVNFCIALQGIYPPRS